MPATIMIVEDNPENLRLLAGALSAEGYDIMAFPSGDMALNAASHRLPDMVLLDVHMPGKTGYEVCEELKARSGFDNIPIIFISGDSGTINKVRGFEAGAVDFIPKPFQLIEVLARVQVHLEVKQIRDSLLSINHDLSKSIAEQVQELYDAQVATVVALVKLAEERDDETGMHIERVSNLSHLLATRVAEHHPDLGIEPAFIKHIRVAAVLHDVGKVGISDSILLKPGKLTDDEFEQMKRHTIIGYDTLMAVVDSYPKNVLVRMGAEIARSHHERWNGSGYPDGLSGEDIPLSARITTMVDVYDALRSDRPYKDAFSAEKAAAIISEERGRQFDPRIFDVFQAHLDELSRAWEALQ